MSVNPAKILEHLEQYRGARCAVLYSAGFDSSLLAHVLLNIVGAHSVALCLLDCGRENDPRDPWFRPERPVDHIADVWQFERYAKHLSEARRLRGASDRDYERWMIPTLPLNALIAQPGNLLPPDNLSAARDERNHGLLFYSGFVMLRLTAALAVAAARGYDYVLTGHMAWNEHYVDESLDFARGVQSLFMSGYGSRLCKIPQIDMPYRELGVTKVDLIEFNEELGLYHRLPPRATISCNVCELHKNAAGAAINFVTVKDYQVHCGHCQHCLDRRAAFTAAGVHDDSFWSAAS